MTWWGEMYCITTAPPATTDRKAAAFSLCCCRSCIDFCSALVVLVRPMFTQRLLFVVFVLFVLFFFSFAFHRMWQDATNGSTVASTLLRIWQPSPCDLRSLQPSGPIKIAEIVLAPLGPPILLLGLQVLHSKLHSLAAQQYKKKSRIQVKKVRCLV